MANTNEYHNRPLFLLYFIFEVARCQYCVYAHTHTRMVFRFDLLPIELQEQILRGVIADAATNTTDFQNAMKTIFGLATMSRGCRQIVMGNDDRGDIGGIWSSIWPISRYGSKSWKWFPWVAERFGRRVNRISVCRSTTIVVSSMISSIDLMPNVRFIDISDSDIDDSHAFSLATALTETPRLQTLIFRDGDLFADESDPDNEFDVSVIGAVDIAEGLGRVPELTTLDLSFNGFGVDGIELISDSLNTTTMLTYLDLQNTFCESEGATAIAENLEFLPSLTYLNVSMNNIGVNGAKALGLSFAQRNVPHLATLIIGHTNMQREGSEAIVKSLASMTALSALDMSRSSECLLDIDDDIDSTKALVACLGRLSGLRSLNFDNNTLMSSGATALASSLQTLTRLQTLDLRMNDIEDTGATALAEALAMTPNGLITLNLCYNSITDVGVNALANCCESVVIRPLELEFNA